MKPLKNREASMKIDHAEYRLGEKRFNEYKAQYAELKQLADNTKNYGVQVRLDKACSELMSEFIAPYHEEIYLRTSCEHKRELAIHAIARCLDLEYSALNSAKYVEISEISTLIDNVIGNLDRE